MTRHLPIAFRTLTRRPGFALPVVLILALGIGATTGVFRLVGTLLFSPPPVAEPERLAWVVRPSDLDDTCSRPEGLQYQERSGAFAGVAQYQSLGADLGRGEAMQRVGLEVVSGDYFQVLGVPAAYGRTLLPEDDPAGGGGDTAVLSTALAGRLFGDPASAVGQTVSVNHRPFSVVGVTPAGFHGLSYDSQVDLWVPLAATTTVATFFRDHADAMDGTRWLRTVGRLAPGVGLDEAQQRLDAVVRWQIEQYPGFFGEDDSRRLHSVAAGHPVVEHDALPRLALVFATAFVILLVAGANAANLLLTRAVARRHELGVRRALGAARRDLVRQLFVEGGLLCAAGGLAGLLLSVWLVPLLAPVLPPGVDVEAFREPDLLIALFAAAATLASALVFALLPALRSTGERALGPLARDAHTASPGRQRGQAALVVVQVALSALLLVTTALLVRTVAASYRVDLGMETAGVAVATLSPGRLGYDETRREALYRGLVERLEAHPALAGVSLLTPPPLAGSWMRTTITPEGYTAGEDEDMNVHLTVADGGLFETLRIHRLAGRGWSDGPAGNGEAVINRTLARRFFGDERSALGRRIEAGPERSFRVVGVVADSHFLSPQLEPQPRLYQRLADNGRHRANLSVLLRGDGVGSGGGRDAEAAAGVALEALASTLRQLDPELIPRAPGTLAASLDQVMAPQRSLALLLAAFTALTLVVSAVGLYGVLTFAVRRRLREIGIRMALGAAGGRIVAGVVARGLILVALGIGGGLLLAALAGRFVESHLFGVTATDPLSYAAVAALLVAVALVACAAPAGRAVAVDPARVLRSE